MGFRRLRQARLARPRRRNQRRLQRRQLAKRQASRLPTLRLLRPGRRAAWRQPPRMVQPLPLARPRSGATSISRCLCCCGLSTPSGYQTSIAAAPAAPLQRHLHCRPSPLLRHHLPAPPQAPGARARWKEWGGEVRDQCLQGAWPRQPREQATTRNRRRRQQPPARRPARRRRTQVTAAGRACRRRTTGSATHRLNAQLQLQLQLLLLAQRRVWPVQHPPRSRCGHTGPTRGPTLPVSPLARSRRKAGLR
mmetsp:Transcript_3163/g.13042  ORF Transcript_3163/g.13042 Transcript_3163/m.13042 type:complete len:250 (-) Transcript_3163:370-1119(-)